jgi:protein involved in polysaccharide export with SLBB domain
MMKKTLLTRILFFAIISCFIPAAAALAQENQSPAIKRNSPFSPNPRGKARTEPQKTPVIETDKAPDNGKSAKVEPAEKTPNTVNAQAENKVQPQTENVKFQTGEFESRSLAKNTLEAAKRAGAKAALPTEIYKVGIGDVLFISLQNVPAKDSTYFTVLKDGTIDYPLAGEMVSVLGLTTDEIEEVLSEKIKLYENPQVSVKVREHNSHIFTVLGMVERPGEKMMQREAMPLFAVRAEAIAQSNANRAIIKRANSQTETIDLRDKKFEDTLIFPGDIVEFDSFEDAQAGDGQPQFFYIGGDIRDGGQKDFHKGITLMQAILVSGGLKKSNFLKLSGSKSATIRRKNEAGLLVTTTYDLKAIRDGKEVDPELEAGDTIEIGN